MINLERITDANLEVFKTVRLRALKEDPLAFGSTYARERQFSDDEWNARLERWNGVCGIGLLAMENGTACGVAGGLIENDPARAQLVSMWTAPTHRRRGVGTLLVAGVADWARERGATVLELMVTSSNGGAVSFYEGLGFVRTSHTTPYPNDPALEEWEMARRLDGVGAVDTSTTSR